MNLVKKITLLALPAMLVVPMMAGAQGSISGAFETILSLITDYIIPLIFAIALVIFLWGVVKYIASGDDEEGKTKGRGLIIYGIIGLAVMASVWGLVGMLTSEFGLNTGGGLDDFPTINY